MLEDDADLDRAVFDLIECRFAAYPIYTRITDKEKARLASEILRLTDELINK